MEPLDVLESNIQTVNANETSVPIILKIENPQDFVKDQPDGYGNTIKVPNYEAIDNAVVQMMNWYPIYGMDGKLYNDNLAVKQYFDKNVMTIYDQVNNHIVGDPLIVSHNKDFQRKTLLRQEEYTKGYFAERHAIYAAHDFYVINQQRKKDAVDRAVITAVGGVATIGITYLTGGTGFWGAASYVSATLATVGGTVQLCLLENNQQALAEWVPTSISGVAGVTIKYSFGDNEGTRMVNAVLDVAEGVIFFKKADNGIEKIDNLKNIIIESIDVIKELED